MSVHLDGDVIRLSAPSRIEDAETLVCLLRADGGRSLDLAEAGPLHTAMLQVLLAFRPRLAGHSGDAFFTSWLLPVLTADTDAR